MSCCCTNTFDLGCVPMCDSIPISISFTGTNWEVHADNNVNEVVLTGSGATITLSNYDEDLQPGTTYTLRIYDADTGAQYSETIGSVLYDCWKVTLNKTIG